MCGIVGYYGDRSAYDVLVKGLKRLEYRGYDSAGVALVTDNIEVFKKQGKVKDLEGLVNGGASKSKVGIGHTRWATHGEPSDTNAHPHLSSDDDIAIIHNGIIENYSSLKQELSGKGYKFQSETDTEVLVQFIHSIKVENKCSLDEAVRIALSHVVGAYAIAVISKDEPDTLVAARKGSPLVIGVGKDEYLLASDASPIIEYTNEVVYLNDGEIAIVKDGTLTIKNIQDLRLTPYIQTLDLELEAIEKGGYPYFMLKEIFEQPNSIADCMRGRINVETSRLVLGGIREYADKLVNAERIILVGCGTSWHAGLVAEYLFEDLCRIPVEVEYASEFRYRNPVISENDVVIAISQSGETADTLAAIELAKAKGAVIIRGRKYCRIFNIASYS